MQNVRLTRRQQVRNIQSVRGIRDIRPLQRAIGPAFADLTSRFLQAFLMRQLRRRIGAKVEGDARYATYAKEVREFDEIYLPVAAGPLGFACFTFAMVAAVLSRPFVFSGKLQYAQVVIYGDLQRQPKDWHRAIVGIQRSSKIETRETATAKAKTTARQQGAPA